ncbi:MAG: hypothetical protein ACKVK9_05730 [Nitrospinaceae bacterium]
MAQVFVLTLTVLLAWQAKELAVEDALPRVQGLGESVQWVSGICSQNPKCSRPVS